jgi:hypothetical protein
VNVERGVHVQTFIAFIRGINVGSTRSVPIKGLVADPGGRRPGALHPRCQRW